MTLKELLIQKALGFTKRKSFSYVLASNSVRSTSYERVIFKGIEYRIKYLNHKPHSMTIVKSHDT